MYICILLYGRQPLAGYQQGSLQGSDDPSLPGIRTRPHRFAVKCEKMAQRLMALGDADPGHSPLYGLQLLPLILKTKCKWKPYQCQVVYKRFLQAKYPKNALVLPIIRESASRLAGPGTVYLFRRLSPAAFCTMLALRGAVAMEDEDFDSDTDDDDSDADDADGDVGDDRGNATVIDAATAEEKEWCLTLLQILMQHANKMHLHKQVMNLLGQKPYVLDEWQFAICELRGFIFNPSRVRRNYKGFLNSKMPNRVPSIPPVAK